MHHFPSVCQGFCSLCCRLSKMWTMGVVLLSVASTCLFAQHKKQHSSKRAVHWGTDSQRWMMWSLDSTQHLWSLVCCGQSGRGCTWVANTSSQHKQISVSVCLCKVVYLWKYPWGVLPKHQTAPSVYERIISECVSHLQLWCVFFKLEASQIRFHCCLDCKPSWR